MDEALLVYLYGIYPEGGLSEIALLYLVIVGFFLLTLAGPLEKIEKAKKWNKTLSIYTKLAIATIIIGYFIPSKNIFLTMVATPHIIKSLESKTGKLNKVNRLFDKTLDQLLDENITIKGI